MNNYWKSDLANYVDSIGKISIRIQKANKNVFKYNIYVILRFISTSSDSLIIIKEKLDDFGKSYKIEPRTNTTFELRIASIYIIKELLNDLLPYIVKKKEHVLKTLEIITLFEKFRKAEPKESVNLFLQVCALVDQYQNFDPRFQGDTEKTVSRRYFFRHTEKTVSEYLKTKVV
jgi:hypothetical protein